MSRMKEDSNSSKNKPKPQIRVLLADDFPLIRQTLRRKIKREDDMVVVGEAADGREAVTLAKERSPDVILMDINMPKLDGIQATRKITAFSKQVKIIGFSLQNHKKVTDSMLEAGAVAYATKNGNFDALCDIIRKVTVKNNPGEDRDLADSN